jgi:hypothetical protein
VNEDGTGLPARMSGSKLDEILLRVPHLRPTDLARVPGGIKADQLYRRSFPRCAPICSQGAPTSHSLICMALIVRKESTINACFDQMP